MSNTVCIGRVCVKKRTSPFNKSQARQGGKPEQQQRERDRYQSKETFDLISRIQTCTDS
jgi:hypothetical protein